MTSSVPTIFHWTTSKKFYPDAPCELTRLTDRSSRLRFDFVWMGVSHPAIPSGVGVRSPVFRFTHLRAGDGCGIGIESPGTLVHPPEPNRGTLPGRSSYCNCLSYTPTKTCARYLLLAIVRSFIFVSPDFKTERRRCTGRGAPFVLV